MNLPIGATTPSTSGENGLEDPCGIEPVGPAEFNGVAGIGGGQVDCARNFTSGADIYDPDATPVMRISVVFHIIRTNDAAFGDVPIAQVQRALEIVNEDFRAVEGTNGGFGTDARIEFEFAQFDPSGNITNGINYYNNSDWFADVGAGNQPALYTEQIAWDPQRYLNIYTNDCGGILGYASIPQYEHSPDAGTIHDRIVLRWDAVGEGHQYGPPRELGHLLTHEIGHYCGLWHVFSNAAGANQCGGACNATGDTICDTNPQASSTDGCQEDGLCGFPANSDNYMDYSDDQCRIRFTPLQIRRMRCTLMHWRTDVFEYAEDSCNNACPGDLDLNGWIDGGDLGMLFASWGPCPAGECCGDLNNDNQVDGADLGALFARWGDCYPCPEGWEKDCMGTCFPSWLVNAWRGDAICDDGSWVPNEHGCAECPANTPIYLDCETFNFDDGDCAP